MSARPTAAPSSAVPRSVSWGTYSSRTQSARNRGRRGLEAFALVAVALIDGVDRPRDLRCLAGYQLNDPHRIGAERPGRVGVPDFSNSRPGDSFSVDVAPGCDLSRHDNGVALDQHFARYPTATVFGEVSIQDGIGDVFTDPVGVSFTDRFGGEAVATGGAM